MMSTPVLAVPKLHAPEPDPAGAELDEVSWAALIDTLRPRLLELKPHELCDFCRESYYNDLLVLVICAPLSEAVLERLQEALSEQVYDMLLQDCQTHGPSRIAADLACATFKRLDALLQQAMETRASPEQLARLAELSRQMAQLDDEMFKAVLATLKGLYLTDLFRVSESTDSLLASRLHSHFGEQSWEYLHERQEEPISRNDAEEILTELPDVFRAAASGETWQSPDERWRASEEGQQVQRKLDEFRKKSRKSWPLWKRVWWHAESLWWKAYWKIGRIFIKPRP